MSKALDALLDHANETMFLNEIADCADAMLEPLLDLFSDSETKMVQFTVADVFAECRTKDVEFNTVTLGDFFLIALNALLADSGLAVTIINKGSDEDDELLENEEDDIENWQFLVYRTDAIVQF